MVSLHVPPLRRSRTRRSKSDSLSPPYLPRRLRTSRLALFPTSSPRAFSLCGTVFAFLVEVVGRTSLPFLPSFLRRIQPSVSFPPPVTHLEPLL